MSQMLVRGGMLATAGGLFEADLLIDEGRIVGIGKQLGCTAEAIVDASGKLVLPGGVDVHVHLPWPTGKVISTDDFASGTQAAACGGVTTVIDFVIPELDEGLAAALDCKLGFASQRAWVDFGLHLNIRDVSQSALQDVRELVRDGFPSFKVFMAYEGFRLPDRDLLAVMRTVGRAGGMLQVHAENGPLTDHLTEELVSAGRTALADYPKSRPALCEEEAIHRILTYARLTGTKLHVHHVSTAKGAELVGRARRDGLPVSGETCPHYLLLDDSCYGGDPAQAARYVCAPPIKSREDQVGLWQALANGDLSILATDHCPYTRQQKEAHLSDFTQVPGGMAGVETRLPLVYTAGVVKKRFSLSRFVSTWATEPAREFGLFPRKGVIAVGSDADLVILDPTLKTALRAEELHMNTDCLPYEGREVYGFPVTTVLRGQVVVDEGRLATETPKGKCIHRYLTDPAIEKGE